MIRSVICGTGRELAPRCITNEDLTELMDTSDEWIRRRTGIEQRYWIPEDEPMGASDLGLAASRKALEKAGWIPQDVDFIIFATLSPDIFFPGSGCLLAEKLGLTTTPALDIRQQCAGFLYGLATADAYIRSGLARRILLVAAEVHSSGMDKSTRGRDLAVIFGDGGAAVCLEGVDTEDRVGVLESCLHADGRGWDVLMGELPASRRPSRLPKGVPWDDPRFYPVMDGQAVFQYAVRILPRIALETLEKTGLSLEDIHMFFPHQANLRINRMFAKSLKIDESLVYNNIQRYGNTTAASIPLALDEALEKGVVGTPGQTILFVGFGAGLTWGGATYRF